jgi:hypothetical protein
VATVLAVLAALAALAMAAGPESPIGEDSSRGDADVDIGDHLPSYVVRRTEDRLQHTSTLRHRT